MRLRRIGLLLAATLPAACDLAPPYEPPEIATPAAYKEESADWAAAKPQDEGPRGNWWQVFHDPALDALEDKVTAANQDLKVAVARFDEARADAQTAQADYYPTIDAAARSRASICPGASRIRCPREPAIISAWGSISATKIDVWGRVRNQAKAGADRGRSKRRRSRRGGAQPACRTGHGLLILRGYDAEQDVLDRTVQDYRKALDLTQARFKIGYAAKPDVSAAEAQFEGARTQATDTELKRANLEHAIAILTRRGTGRLQPAGADARRDAARDRSDAAYRAAGAATGHRCRRAPDCRRQCRYRRRARRLLPDLQSQHIVRRAVGDPRPAIQRAGRSLVLRPFGAGQSVRRRQARCAQRQARASYDEAVAQYRQTVLDAFGEVEDNLASLRLLAREHETQQAAVSAAADSTHQAGNLYSGGLETYYDVILAQNIELTARLSEVDIRTRRMTASVLLIKALGGGWHREDGLDPTNALRSAQAAAAAS